MSAEPLRLERRGSALIAMIDRPERMNSLSRDTLRAFGRLEAELRGDSETRAIILTGAGNKAFCAGADLKERQAMSDEQVREQLLAYRTELGWLEHSARPVIAAINGAALGGGLELALLCDLRVASEHAVLALPETTLAIIPGAGGTQRLPRLIGSARAKELILLGRRLSARQALDFGLVNHVVETDVDLLEATLSYIEPILQGAPIAQSAALTAIDAAAEYGLERGLEVELECYERTLVSEDRREALRALTEKRKPVYRGV